MSTTRRQPVDMRPDDVDAPWAARWGRSLSHDSPATYVDTARCVQHRVDPARGVTALRPQGHDALGSRDPCLRRRRPLDARCRSNAMHVPRFETSDDVRDAARRRDACACHLCIPVSTVWSNSVLLNRARDMYGRIKARPDARCTPPECRTRERRPGLDPRDGHGDSYHKHARRTPYTDVHALMEQLSQEFSPHDYRSRGNQTQ
jgi:hypothetical protein